MNNMILNSVSGLNSNISVIGPIMIMFLGASIIILIIPFILLIFKIYEFHNEIERKK